MLYIDEQVHEETHILPVGDYEEHVFCRTCWCKPVDMGGGIWVHNDADEADDDIRH